MANQSQSAKGHAGDQKLATEMEEGGRGKRKGFKWLKGTEAKLVDLAAVAADMESLGNLGKIPNQTIADATEHPEDKLVIEKGDGGVD